MILCKYSKMFKISLKQKINSQSFIFLISKQNIVLERFYYDIAICWSIVGKTVLQALPEICRISVNIFSHFSYVPSKTVSYNLLKQFNFHCNIVINQYRHFICLLQH